MPFRGQSASYSVLQFTPPGHNDLLQPPATNLKHGGNLPGRITLHETPHRLPVPHDGVALHVPLDEAALESELCRLLHLNLGHGNFPCLEWVC